MNFGDLTSNMMLLFFIYLALINGYSNAITEEEIKADFINKVVKCLKDHPVDISEVANLKALVVPKKTEVKCLIACAYKLDGIMNAKGFYVVEHAYKMAELAKNGDEKRLENGKKLAELCSEVNDVEVNDGEEGCERAGLIFKCAIENALKFGFTI